MIPVNPKEMKTLAIMRKLSMRRQQINNLVDVAF